VKAVSVTENAKSLVINMSASKPRVLFVLTSHDTMGSSGNKTGWYLPEFAHPYDQLIKVADVTVASPKGGAAPVDEGSVTNFKSDEVCNQFWENKSTLWKNTEKLGSFLGKANEFAAIFYVGGHGPMFDLATDQDSIELIKEFFEAGKIVGAVCHGPAALVNAKLSDGTYLIANAAVTGFSNDEEDSVDLSKYMPFMLETELNKKSGGKYEKASKQWEEHVVVAKDGRLITGQNPSSATAIGKAIAQAISA
jgi:putative intracellular protease/amidase